MTKTEFESQAVDWLNQAFYRKTKKLTPFLSPKEQQELLKFSKRYDGLVISLNGGFIGAERCRALICPYGDSIEGWEYEIEGFQVSYPKKFAELEHRQLLGALMALQIQRSRIGDIFIDEEQNAFLAVCGEVSDFVQQNLTSAGSSKVSLDAATIQKIARQEKLDRKEILVSSMRLDVILAGLLGFSRSQASEYLKEGLVQVNHEQEKNHSRNLQEGDVLSIKKYGRCRLLEVVRQTKSGRLVVAIGKYV